MVYCRAKAGDRMDWFELIKALKERSGMTNHLIAERSGVPEPTLEKIFSGATKKPGINTIIDIIHAMGGTLDSIDPVAQMKKSPSTANAVPGDEYLTEAMDLWGRLHQNQKEAIVSLLRSMNSEAQ